MSELAHHNDQQVPSPSAPTQKPNNIQNSITLCIPDYVPSFADPGDETDRPSTMLKIWLPDIKEVGIYIQR
jgi:hypothetical protein